MIDALSMPSTTTVGASQVRVLNDSLVEQTLVRRQVGTSAANGADQVTGKIPVETARGACAGTACSTELASLFLVELQRDLLMLTLVAVEFLDDALATAVRTD